MYSIYKRKKEKFNTITAPFPSFQFDLLDMTKYSEYNNDYNYIFICIEVTSRYVIIEKTKKKESKEIHPIINKIIKEYKPIYITSDCEKSFKEYNKLNKKQYKKWYFVDSSNDYNHKLSRVDRFSRTLRELLNKNKEFLYTNIWINIIDDIIKNYNLKPHNSLPKHITLKRHKKTDELYKSYINYNPFEVFTDCNNQYTKILNKSNNVNYEYKTLGDLTNGLNLNKNNQDESYKNNEYKVGDTVRILDVKHMKNKDNEFYKNGRQLWSNKIYKIKDKIKNHYILDGEVKPFNFNELLKIEVEPEIKQRQTYNRYRNKKIKNYEILKKDNNENLKMIEKTMNIFRDFLNQTLYNICETFKNIYNHNSEFISIIIVLEKEINNEENYTLIEFYNENGKEKYKHNQEKDNVKELYKNLKKYKNKMCDIEVNNLSSYKINKNNLFYILFNEIKIYNNLWKEWDKIDEENKSYKISNNDNEINYLFNKVNNIN